MENTKDRTLKARDQTAFYNIVRSDEYGRILNILARTISGKQASRRGNNWLEF